MANNRHIKYLDFDDHGFSVLDITAERTQMDWFVIGDARRPQTTATHDASFRDPRRHRHGAARATPVGGR